MKPRVYIPHKFPGGRDPQATGLGTRLKTTALQNILDFLFGLCVRKKKQQNQMTIDADFAATCFM